MRFATLQEGVLLRRYKRFLADVELPGGDVITVHCPNTGAMTGCAEPGSPVWLSFHDAKTRKYPYTWELVATGEGMACIHSGLANAVVREALEAGLVPGFDGYPEITPEVKYGEGSRIDLLLGGAKGRVFVEVKSVTLCREGGLGVFPDAVSDRGRRHLEELARIAGEARTRAVLLFCVLHTGVSHVSVAGDIDPRYRAALLQAQAAGVEVLAWGARVEPAGVELVAPLPFSVDPP